MKFFSSPTAKWLPLKNFTKLNGNHLSIFSNFTNIRHFVYWKCIIWAKSDLPIIKLVYGKFCFRLSRQSKMLFCSFYLFSFSKFQMTIFKVLMEQSSFFVSCFEIILHHKYFWSTNIWQCHDGSFILLYFILFEICIEMHFISLFFSKWKKWSTF